MRIAVIGAGAMGSIYGGHLSLHNEVLMIDTAAKVVDQINRNGIRMEEKTADGKTETNCYHPEAVTSAQGREPADLVILFVKAIYSRAALEENRCIIGPDTYLMTLQNGSGHEDLLKEFAAEDHIIIGTTEDNGAVIEPGKVVRGGTGVTNIGMLVEDEQGILPAVKEALDQCGFQTRIYENILQLIWNKLFLNVSLSAVTGILQVDMGYIAADPYAWELTVTLIKEAAAVAKAMGLSADVEAICEHARKTSEMSPAGCTSIRADLRDGRKTEVDTISGSVVRAAAKYGVEVPCHRFVVTMVHAMEDKKRVDKEGLTLV